MIEGELGRAFEVKDLGPLLYFVRIEIARPSSCYISNKICLDLLVETRMLRCCQYKFPIDINHQANTQFRDPVDR